MVQSIQASSVRGRRLGTLFLIGLLAAACGGSPPSPTASTAIVASPPATASPKPTPTPAPSASPSPSPVASPGELALAALADPSAKLHADYTGTIGPGTSKGTYDQSGRDFALVVTTTLEDVSFAVEQRIAGDESYLSTPGKPWLHDVTVSGANRAPTLSEALQTAELTPAGTTNIGGIDVAQFGLTGVDFSDLAASMGLSDPGAKVTDASAWLFATPEGKPFVLDIAFTVDSPNGTPYASDYTFIFGAPPSPGLIEPPADSWVRKAEGHGYAMWYPEAWRANPIGEADGGFTDGFVGPDAMVRVFCNPKAKLKLKEWAADGRAYYSKEFGGKPDQVGEETFGGLPARWSRWENGTFNGNPAFIVNVALVKGPGACDVQWFRVPGPTAAQDEVFTQLLNTFSLD